MTQVSDNMWPLVRSLPHQRMRLDELIHLVLFLSSTFKVTTSNLQSDNFQSYRTIVCFVFSSERSFVRKKSETFHQHNSTPPKMTRPMDVPKATWWSLDPLKTTLDTHKPSNLFHPKKKCKENGLGCTRCQHMCVLSSQTPESLHW